MIRIYSAQEIELISQGGRITGQVLKKTLARVKAGISTRELDEYVEKEIRNTGAKPSFQTVSGYRHATCMNVNDMVVHGIPAEIKLQDGDRLGIDLGAFYKGFHTDASWSIIVGGKEKGSPDRDGITRFLKTGEDALNLAIKQCQPGNHIGHISKAIQDTIEKEGYSCVRQLVGHGVGHELHEDPEIPCYLRGRIENTAEIKVGMVLAIEAIYNMGKSQVVYANDDGWTIVSQDGLPSGLFEHTVAVTADGPKILTLAIAASARYNC